MGECNFVECNSVRLTYYQRDRDMILNRAKDYYENDKERFRRGGRGGEQEISTETYLKKKKNKKIEYGKNRYRNMSEEKNKD